jgi:hypothetical protein
LKPLPAPLQGRGRDYSDYSEFSDYSDYSEDSEYSESSEFSDYSDYSDKSDNSSKKTLTEKICKGFDIIILTFSVSSPSPKK